MNAQILRSSDVHDISWDVDVREKVSNREECQYSNAEIFHFVCFCEGDEFLVVLISDFQIPVELGYL